MIWTSGFSGRFYYTKVDARSWRDIGTYELTSGTITKTTDTLAESATIQITEDPGAVETWIRIWLDASQNDAGERIPLFTGLLQTPAVDWDGVKDSYDAECYSVLTPAKDILLPRGWYATAGLNGAQQAAALLAVGSAPVTFEENAPALTEYLVAEDNETNLTMARKIVDAIGWRIRVDGYGNINICPQATEAGASFDTVANDIVEPQIKDVQDWFSCPNVFRATSGNLTAIATDEDPDSILSIPSRGREVWAEERDVKLNSGEGIAEYSQRRLRELQRPAKKISYSRRFAPDVYPNDLISLNLPQQNISGTFRITRQQIELGYGARVSEEVEQE